MPQRASENLPGEPVCTMHVHVQNKVWTDAEGPVTPDRCVGNRSPSKALCCPDENNHDTKGKWKV